MNDVGAELSAVQALMATLAPEMISEADRLKLGQQKLVHYTSAENALKIIESQEFWLRNVKCMNDFSEVQHGINLMLRTFHENESARRDRLLKIFDERWPGAAKAGIDQFDEWLSELPDSTYIACLSLFDTNDTLGRLSMWRSYSSSKGGVALVLNCDPFLAESDELKAYSLPVAYLSDVGFAEAIDRCMDTLEGSVNQFAELSSESLTATIFWWLLALSLSLKHPAFYEEREWRIVYVPSMGRSPIIKQSVECVGGLPQVVQKIPLCHDPDNGLFKADIPHLLDRVMIGPTDFPLVLHDAFVELLKSRDVPEAEAKVFNSFIPLRQGG